MLWPGAASNLSRSSRTGSSRSTTTSSVQVERYIDLLADEGVHLGEPFTRQLRGKLRELRFYLGRQQTRITYYIASGRRIVLLTVFRKTRQREQAEIERWWQAMQRCVNEGHTAEDES